MSKLAIDIVILPPENIASQAIDINSHFEDDPIKLNAKDCLPHLSLCMGVIDEKDLDRAKDIINQLVEKFSKLKLTISKINGPHVCFEISENDSLQKLHEEIMTDLSPYLSYDAKVENFYPPTDIDTKTIGWVNKYKNSSSFKNFFPHITLGISKIADKNINVDFEAQQIAICHLGKYCTCKKILHSINLK